MQHSHKRGFRKSMPSSLIRGWMPEHSAAWAEIQEGLWQAEVTKMIKVYGAPIDDADVGKIVDYLAATY